MNKLKEIRYRTDRRISQFSLGIRTGIAASKLSLIENSLVTANKEEKEKLAMALLPEKKVEEAIAEMFPGEEIPAESKKSN